MFEGGGVENPWRLSREWRKERERTQEGEGRERVGGWGDVEGSRGRVSGSWVESGSAGCSGSGGFRERWILVSRALQVRISQLQLLKSLRVNFFGIPHNFFSRVDRNQ